MLINEILPCAELTKDIRLYRLVHFKFPVGVPIPDKAYTPRPEHCLQFTLRGEFKVYHNGISKNTFKSVEPVFVGQQTATHYRVVPSEMLVVQVVFQPWAVFRWFGLPSNDLTNVVIPADRLFSKEVNQLNEKLLACSNYKLMITLVEDYLIAESKKIKIDVHRIDHVFDDFLKLKIPSIDSMADKACLSYRQFDRKFIERTGITPKEYFRVVRFDQTFRTKNRSPELDWLSIAIKFGYHDYQHLAKDYKYFTTLTPHQLIDPSNAPEKLIGDAET
ncbi:helix-turn-helix domain-containing protein [Chryseolinea sp. T2]|uniref:helix-turn-helix domain-containing protein n=1 Tax=Chryseolinea sp. T2 TaxID=3129255 RepID=UPI003077FA28